MRIILTFSFLSIVFQVAYPQASAVQRFAKDIEASQLKENLSIIAADAMEGRLTGSRGQKMAAAFIRHHFQSIGLKGPSNGSYFQEFELYTTEQGPASIQVNGTDFQNFEDVIFHDSWNGELQTEVVFAGDGNGNLDKMSLNGKAVLVHWQGFSLYSSKDIVNKLKAAGAKMILLYPKSTYQEFKNVASQVKDQTGNAEYFLQKPEVRVNEPGVVFVSKNVVEALVDQASLKSTLSSKRLPKKLSTARFNSKVRIKAVQTENVLGFLEGTDKKNEVIVITAHYDHVGTATNGEDRVYNGADDDGSGTVAVLQIAKAFAEAKKQGMGPRRSILFMTVSAEEWGLFGSEYYTEHPVFPLTQTIANLNIDMIGRRDEEHKDKPDYVYVIGADKLSSQLHEINERNNTANTKLDFDYTYNDEHHPTNLYQRSDHWNFAKNRVPIIFYFDGIHRDYHQVSDEVDKIDFDLLTKRTQCIFYTAWEIANREERLVIDK